jgi:hypothetical protein
MGQLAADIYNEAARQIPTAPVTDPADLVTGDKLMNVFSVVSQAVEVLELLQRGARIVRLTTAPDDILDGEDGDLGLNLTTSELYAKDGGAWSFLFRLKGDKGDRGRPGLPGSSAYEVAVEEGFQGGVTQWLASLGVKGDDGRSAYQVATANGFVGNVTQWLESLKGNPGDEGAAGTTTYHESFAPTLAYPGKPGDTFYWHVSKTQYAMYDYPNTLLAAGANPWRERFASPEAAGGGSGGNYTLPVATAAGLGGVKSAGTGLAGNVVVNADGSMSAPAGGTPVVLEQNLSSNSAFAAPSVAAVSAAVLSVLKTRVNLVTEQGKRVATLGVTGRWVLSNLVFFNNVNTCGFQLNKRVNGNWQPGSYRQTLSGINTDLVGLTDAELAAGVEMEIATDPLVVADDLTVQFLIQE